MNAHRSNADVREAVPQVETRGDAPELVRAAQDVLEQGLDLLIKLDDGEYSRQVASPFHTSIGQHYRHIIEHFQCLLRGLDCGEIDYDARERNPRIENETSYASIVTCEILLAFKHVTNEMLTRPCVVVASVGYGSSRPSRIPSNVGRELAYCLGHGVHHYAIVRFLCSDTGVAIPAEFGYAPSTLKHMSASSGE